MTFLPYVAASYTLGVILPAGFAVAAWRRMRLATARLVAIDPRRARRAAAARTDDPSMPGPSMPGPSMPGPSMPGPSMPGPSMGEGA